MKAAGVKVPGAFFIPEFTSASDLRNGAAATVHKKSGEY
jgi:hypothetical protein